MLEVPDLRVRRLNDAAIREDGDYVLYWMIANRRVNWNYSLDRAVEHCRELGNRLLILEALRCDYRWASDRLHRFVLQGMADNRRSLAGSPVRYYPYVEPEKDHGQGLLAELAKRAAVVVTDDFPCFFLPRMIEAVAQRLHVRMEAVDSNGLLPLRATDRVFARAYDFRRWLQKNLRPFLGERPKRSPFAGGNLLAAPSIPQSILDRWPEPSDRLLSGEPEELASLPIDHSVGAAVINGGADAGDRTVDRFFNERLDHYADDRNQPDDESASGLSPYLHFGHVSAHEIFSRVAEREEWSEDDLASDSQGSREGWWGMSPESEGFLDQLITWRELGYNMSTHLDNYDQYESLPDWAQKTLSKHESDSRDHVYDFEQFESADTHDELWNATQMQLIREGRIHNYLRMLWGKKILEWTPSPREALDVMVELNNKYAVDGRNPNSYSGIFWVLGRYDRAWGPERPIFGKIRYMSSENTVRKLRVNEYLEKFAPAKS